MRIKSRNTKTQKVWVVCYIAGNPEIFNKVYKCTPMRRSNAKTSYDSIANDWRKWIEHVDTGKRLIENDVEERYKEGING
jgi:hypothetical protein